MSATQWQPFRSDKGSSRLDDVGEKVRLTVQFPDGNAWVEWTEEQAEAIRDALSEWLASRP
jgi:hypothetical protein